MSQRYVFKKSPDPKKGLEKGEWRKFQDKAVCCCPGCGNAARLNHDIDADGNVNPSLDCPTETCSFHRMVRLEGWAA